MSNLDQIIDYTKLFQDVELATAIGQLKKDPSQLQQFLQGQQDKVYKDVIKQKDSTFQKVYGDLGRAATVQESILMYDKRNKELAEIQEQIYSNQEKSATAVTDDKNLAGRKYEMNEWSVGNKKDTLFVFSMLFIVLTALVLITVLWRLGLISSTLWVGIAAPLILIFTLTVVNRSQYTDIFRNKRYWNRKIFEGKYGKFPIPLCPDALNDISSMESDVQNATKNVGQRIDVELSKAASSAANATASAAQTLSNNIKSNPAPIAPPVAPVTTSNK